MPIYEYVCESCGELTEALRKISDPPLETCPICGDAALRKKVSAVSFRLKGGGWYETDFKTGDKKKNLVADESKGGGAEDKPADAGKTPGSDSASTGSKTASEKSTADKSSTGKSTNNGGSSSAA